MRLAAGWILLMLPLGGCGEEVQLRVSPEASPEGSVDVSPDYHTDQVFNCGPREALAPAARAAISRAEEHLLKEGEDPSGVYFAARPDEDGGADSWIVDVGGKCGSPVSLLHPYRLRYDIDLWTGEIRAWGPS